MLVPHIQINFIIILVFGTALFYITPLEYLRDGRLSGVKIGRKWRVPSNSLRSFIYGDREPDSLGPKTDKEVNTTWQAYLNGREKTKDFDDLYNEIFNGE